MILFLNACVRKESRTRSLASYLISKLHDDVKTVQLSELDFPRADESFLKKRDACIEKGDYSAAMFDLAKEFAAADTIVIAAPFWDFSFPAALKQYIEQINVLGITFSYTEEGVPVGLCRAEKLYYVTTAGGRIFSDEYGYGYVKALAQNFYGIKEVEIIKAIGLDIMGADAGAIMDEIINKI